MTAPDVRSSHLAHVASIPEADLTSPLTGEQDTTPTWPHTLWGGAHTVRHHPTPPDLEPDEWIGGDSL